MDSIMQVSELSIYTEDSDPILRDVSFGLQNGDIGIIDGLSGDKKRALISVLIGEQQPNTGQILMVGRNIVSVNKKKALSMRRKEIGFVPETFSLPNRRVIDTLKFKMECLGGPRDQEAKIDDALRDTGLDSKKDLRKIDLSEPERITLAIALGIVHRPALLICDDPFSSLSPEEGEKIFNSLKSIRDNRSITILIASKEKLKFEDGEKKINIGDSSGKL